MNKMSLKTPGQLLHKAGVILGGIWVASSILNATLGEPPKSPLKSSLGSKIKNQSSIVNIQPRRILLIPKELNQIKLKKSYKAEEKNIPTIILLSLKPNGEIKLLNIPTHIRIEDRITKKETLIKRKIQEEGFDISIPIIRDILDLDENHPYGYIALNSIFIESILNNARIRNEFEVGYLSSKPIKVSIEEKYSKKDSEISILIRILLKAIAKRSNIKSSELDFNEISSQAFTRLTASDLLFMIDTIKKTKDRPIIENL